MINVGDLVKMGTHETGLIGLVVERDSHPNSIQIGIKWIGGSGKVDWEPESWLEVVSEGR